MRLFCPDPLVGIDIHPLFYFRFAPGQKPPGLFKEHVPLNYFEQEAEYTLELEGAQAIVLPNNFRALDDYARAYIKRFADEGQRLHIPVFLFSSGDFTDRLIFDPRVFVLRLSLYRSRKGTHDISMPTLTEDLGRGGIVPRRKMELPTVSFCGQAGYKSLLQWIKYYLKTLLQSFDPARRLGVYWRRRMLSACLRSKLVHTYFIIRRSFSGAHSTIELDPAQARREFVKSIVEADFVLAPKGDGNYSNRFLEALSLGRVPVIVDTDLVLPLEHVIDYSRIVIRIPMSEVRRTPAYIRAFYDGLSEVEWQARQREARAVFEEYLRQDSFFRYLFTGFSAV